jgi:DNA polymerase-3 subunit epsilon
MDDGGMMSKGFAVIDVETTGFSAQKYDRIVEIGIVFLDSQGDLESTYCTLVNPNRDVGPTHVHGITAKEVFDAPEFKDIAQDLISLLTGRVLVFHNAQFDTSFLFAEFERAGYWVNGAQIPVICTMQLASDFLPGNGRSLEACCGAYDINNSRAHSALADAEATAELLRAYMNQEPNIQIWDQALDQAEGEYWPVVELQNCKPKNRSEENSLDSSFVKDVVSRLPEIEGNYAEIGLLALFDDILSDGEITEAEAGIVEEYVQNSEISAQRFNELRDLYFWGFTQIAWADEVLNPAEVIGIRYVGKLMGKTSEVIDRALTEPLGNPSDVARVESINFRFESGDIVVLTGDMPQPRSYYEQKLEARGIISWPSVTKKAKAVLAADIYSLSGKAKRARVLGIPVLPLEEVISQIS